MRLSSNLHVKGKPAVLPDRAIRRQSHYFIYRPRTLLIIYISGPPYVPVLGSSLYLLRKLMHISMAGEWRQKYGPVVGFLTATREIVAVCGPHEVLEVLNREEFQARSMHKLFSDRSFGKRLGNGTFALFIFTGANICVYIRRHKPLRSVSFGTFIL
jgi:hypothetical protein